jgi:hypothetical protein
VVLAAFAPAVVHADVDTETTRAAASLIAAVRTHDVRGVAAHFDAAFTNGGVWFADAACSREFSEPSEVTGKRVDLFVRCLARQRVQLSTRLSARREGAVLTVAPGFEIELAFRGSHVRWIGHPLHASTGAIIPTLTAQAFEALRTKGTTALDAVLSPKLLGLAPGTSTSAWMKVCLDAKGAVSEVSYHGVSSSSVGEAFEHAISEWAFRPFEIRGAAIPVCSLSLLTYPAAEAPAIEVLPATSVPLSQIKVYDFDDDLIDFSLDGPPPAPPPPQQSITAIALERMRVTGTKDIEPDAATRAQMIGAGKLSVLASVKVCVNVRGRVSAATLIKPSGFAAYDQKLVREVSRWTFRPYLVAKNPVEVCTTVSFLVVPDPTMLNP